MREEFSRGRMIFVSFVVIDFICLVSSNMLAYRLYMDYSGVRYRYSQYSPVIFIMLAAYIIALAAFNPLRCVLRRRKRAEILECLRSVLYSFVLLTLILFLTKTGAVYSRMIVFLAYFFYFVSIVLTHTAWKYLLKKHFVRREKATAILMSTDAFVNEGLKEAGKSNVTVEGIYLLKDRKQEEICGIPVMPDVNTVIASICWDYIKTVYIYGLDRHMIPDKLVAACREMHVPIQLVDFKYRIVDVKTVTNEDPKYGSLSFLEGKRDIPFPIRRVYWITETEASLHRGFHAHKLNCQLLFCPYGVIDIILDDGKEKIMVKLDRPEKGLLLMPGLWREMIWQKSGSVLCVLASEYYDPDEYIRDYDEFVAFR